MKKGNTPAILDIMKKNWLAVALFIVLGLLSFHRHHIVPSIRGRFEYLVFIFIQAILFLGIYTVRMMILTGLLRMAHLYGPKEQWITKLLKVGAHFFRRLLLFIMMYVAAQLAIHLVFVKLSNAQFLPSGFKEWMGPIHFLFAIILPFALMKLLLLVPALIIVRDCTVLDAIKSIKDYKLLGAQGLVLLFVAYQLCSFLFGPLLPLKGYSGIFIKFYASKIIKNLLLVITGLGAIEFVGGLGTQTDNE